MIGIGKVVFIMALLIIAAGGFLIAGLQVTGTTDESNDQRRRMSYGMAYSLIAAGLVPLLMLLVLMCSRSV